LIYIKTKIHMSLVNIQYMPRTVNNS